MSSRRKIILAPDARDDLRDILQVSFERWGSRQRDDYRRQLRAEFLRIARYPEIGIARSEFGMNARSRLCGSHLVLYVPANEGIVITRIIHQRRDPASLDED
ncbi:MAG: type II toxin-antitoxin system RelE/ParE family toxin, partial [Thermomicrobiales bacterium]